MHHQAECGYAEEIKSLQRQGVDYFTLLPCKMRCAVKMNVLRFAKLGSRTPFRYAQGVLGPTPKRHHPCPDEHIKSALLRYKATKGILRFD